MVEPRARTIKGKKYYYLEKSVRVPSGKIKKVSLYLKNYSPARKGVILQEYASVLQRKAKELLVRERVGSYASHHIFTPEALRTIEEIKMSYKALLKAMTEHQLQDLFDIFT